MRDVHRMRERIELQLDNRQIVSFVIGSLVVLGVVFALGVLVGKQLALGSLEPQRPADPLAALDAAERARVQPESVRGTGELRAEVAGTGAAAAPVVAEAKPAAAALTYAEVLTQRQEPEVPVAAPEPPPARPQAEPARIEKPAAPPEAAPERKTGLAAAFEKASGKQAPQGAYCLQVASLTTRADAEKEAAKLSAKGVSPYIVEADIPNKGLYYRVRVGGFATRPEAEEALDGFREKTGRSAMIVSTK